MNGVTVLGLLWLSFLGALGAVGLVMMLAFLLRRHFVNYMADGAVKRLLKDPYHENLWDLMVGMTRMPPHVLMETELRAEMTSSLERPLGTVTRPVDLGKIAFSPAQLIRPPLGPEAPVDISVVLGPKAAIPVRLQTPIMVSALGYAVSMSEAFCNAVAKGAARAGAAYNAGSGPVLESVMQESKILVLQYTGGAWNRDPDILAEADMIEIRYGHGGRASAGRVIEVASLPKEARQMMGAQNGTDKLIMEAPIPGAATPEELKRLVPELRRLIGGRPVAVKLALTHDLEQELAVVLEAGVDVIALDGKAGGTHGAPPAITDEMGLPLVHGLVRAVRFLEQAGARQQVSLIAGGGLRTPGEMLKALALGADAVYTGTAVMVAAAHAQVAQATPFEPITSLVWANGSKAGSFDEKKGAQNVANFLLSCTDELREALRALGKRALTELSPQDLIALDREAAETLSLAPAWKAPAHAAAGVAAPAGGSAAGAGLPGGQAAGLAQPAVAAGGTQPAWQPPAAAGGTQPAWQPPAAAGGVQPWQPPAAAGGSWQPPGQKPGQQPGQHLGRQSPGAGGAQPWQPPAAAAGGQPAWEPPAVTGGTQSGQQQPFGGSPPSQGGAGLRVRRVRYPAGQAGGSGVQTWFPPGPSPGARQAALPGQQSGQLSQQGGQGAQPGQQGSFWGHQGPQPDQQGAQQGQQSGQQGAQQGQQSGQQGAQQGQQSGQQGAQQGQPGGQSGTPGPEQTGMLRSRRIRRL